MTLLLQLLWLAVPVIISGLVHLAVMKLDLFPDCARCRSTAEPPSAPRVFGDNKTWRGRS